ncbi:MAG: TIGR01777 family oxidoreductase [Deltaproteobacteria bacterium]|nr:TIGR01777 family oxidoreductase [Deltaproteobacteria bacterium]
MKVVVTGATGFIGRPLVRALVARGHAVTALTRSAARATDLATRVVETDLESATALTPLLANHDAVIHLAGEPVAARRWDARQKQRIRDSRVESTRAIVEALAAAPSPPRTLLTASGIDIYAYATGPLDDDEVTEADPPADTFLGRVCRDWEREARTAEPLGVRVAAFRTGLVLGPGGALARLETPFKLFAGGRVGSGRQWVSWIHRDDVVNAYLAALTDERYTGPINAITDSTRNADFSRAIGRALHRPSWLPVPAFALKAAVGELAESILNGRRAIPAKLRALGFAFSHPDLDEAVASALTEKR